MQVDLMLVKCDVLIIVWPNIASFRTWNKEPFIQTCLFEWRGYYPRNKVAGLTKVLTIGAFIKQRVPQISCPPSSSSKNPSHLEVL
jgi:hypothetical protein